MKKSYIYILELEVFSIIAMIYNIIAFKIFNQYTLFLFLALLILIFYFILGFERNKCLIDKDIILTILICCMAYYLIIYIIGFFIGFYKNIYSTQLIEMFKNILPVILLIVSREILRYMINKKCSKKLLILSFIMFCLIDNTILLQVIYSNGIKSIDTLTLINYFGLMILPNICNNLLLTYVSYKSSYKPCIIYSLLMELPVYIISIYPDFGPYIESIIKITLPILILVIIYKNIIKYKAKKKVIISNNNYNKIFKYILFVMALLLVYLTSGYFKYRTIVIATGSMEPKIHIGDMVIIKKLTDLNKQNLEVGNIIAYKKNNIIICHRIVKKVKSGDYLAFETQGDNNNSPDAYLVTDDQVIGSYVFDIHYIGYPTVWIYEKAK